MRQVFPFAGVVFHCIGNHWIGFWLAGRTINWWADIGVAISQADFASFQRAGVRPEKLRLISNGVPTSRTSKSGQMGLAAQLDLNPEQDMIVASLGRLVPAKGFDLLLRSVARLKSDFPRLRVVIGGERPKRDQLKGLTKELGVADIVHLPGLIDKPGDLLAFSTLYAHAARHEPFGLVVAEAMSSRLPVVASAVGGIVDQVVDGQTGLLVPKGDERRFARAMAELLGDREKAQRMGSAGFERQRAHFSLDAMAAKVEVVYREALQARGRLPDC